MSVKKLRIDGLRCLREVELEPDSAHNVIIGANGAGKTSILEALFFLGRGRSFRAGKASSLIQTGAEEFTVFAEVDAGSGSRRLGAQVGRGGSKYQIDGNSGVAAAELITALPVQIIDPQVHELIQGGPKGRRRFLDWGVFHVKQDFFPVWRRYRRALQQRNRALRQGQVRREVAVWEAEIVAAGDTIDSLRREYLESFELDFETMSAELLGFAAKCSYRPGWPQELDLAGALEASWERDNRYGQTHVGPHRAELVLDVEDVAARNRLSRGQQKLLGISLILAQSEFVAGQLDRDVTLLVDEPAAELDGERLAKLVGVLKSARAQLFITALEREALPMDDPVRVFHVEHGKLTTLV